MYQITRKIRHLLNGVLDWGSVLIFFFLIKKSNKCIKKQGKLDIY